MFPVLLLLLAAAPAAAAGRLVGTVVDAAGDPVEGASVRAQAGEPPELVALAQTDGNGRYALAAPDGLFTLSVKARGYYVLSAGGIESETITHSCSTESDCGEVSFRLGKPGVVEGWLTDRFGDPAANVFLVLRLAGVAAAPSNRSARANSKGQGMSDDRGYFRIWNVRPGRYVLEADSRMLRFADFRPSFQLQPQEIEIGEAKTVELRLAVDSGDALYTISGVVDGIETPQGGYAAVSIQPKSGDGRAFNSHAILRKGRFTIGGVKAGDYVLRVAEGTRGREGQVLRILGDLHVDHDMQDLRLTPQPGATLHLKVNFREMARRNLDLILRPAGGAGVADYLIVRGPDYETTNSGLVSGDYELKLTDPDCYLAQAYQVTLQNGQTTLLTIEIGNQFASLHGQVRVAQGAQRAGASHFTIGARGPHGRYKTQADDEGRFAFAKLPPGPYKLAAWPKPDINPEDDEAWADARGVVSIEIEPGFDVEMDVTASP
jgi:Carboxypeptidase regulatory-like domain